MRCLIVDDSRRFMRAARVLLEREGLVVAGVASTSDEAMVQAASLRPDVVLVDVALGEESGLALARRLVGEGSVSASAVILISTRSQQELTDLIAESPVAGFLSKAELSGDAIRRIINDNSK